MKNSKKREQILEIFKNKDLLTANEVCMRLPEIDRATIYRNLALFVEQEILREVNVKKGVSSYELNIKDDNHQHFICKVCEKVFPVDVDLLKLKRILPIDINFEQFELNLKGKCQNCS